MDARQITLSALIKPRGINALDPTVLFSTFYTGLTYGIYYSFFECFPLVYNDMYGFNLGELGLSFLSVLCGLVVQWLYYAPTSTMYSLNVLANLIQSYQKHVSGLGCLQYLFGTYFGPYILYSSHSKTLLTKNSQHGLQAPQSTGWSAWSALPLTCVVSSS